MRDFLRGTLGRLAMVALAIIGFIFMIVSLVSCGSSHMAEGWIFFILGIVCWCSVGGIRYWLGNIFRMR